jgi:hypothetical protein
VPGEVLERELRLAVEVIVHSRISLLHSGEVSPARAVQSIVDEVMQIIKGESPLLSRIHTDVSGELPVTWREVEAWREVEPTAEEPNRGEADREGANN